MLLPLLKSITQLAYTKVIYAICMVKHLLYHACVNWRYVAIYSFLSFYKAHWRNLGFLDGIYTIDMNMARQSPISTDLLLTSQTKTTQESLHYITSCLFFLKAKQFALACIQLIELSTLSINLHRVQCNCCDVLITSELNETVCGVSLALVRIYTRARSQWDCVRGQPCTGKDIYPCQVSMRLCAGSALHW